MRFSTRTARVRYIEHLLTTQPFVYTVQDLAEMTERSRVTIWRDVQLLETECPRMGIMRDDEWRLGLICREG